MTTHSFVSVVATLMLTLTAGQAQAAVTTGPVFPPPGGVTFSGSGPSAISGTRVGSYSGFDLSATGDLYFTINPIRLAMDGSVDTSGETLSLDLGLSNLGNGLAVFTGSTRVFSFGSPVAVNTRFTMQALDVLNAPLALTTNADIGGGALPVLLVNGNYKIQTSFQAAYASGGTLASAQSLFDGTAGKSPTAGQLVSSTSGAFYYTAAPVPEPQTWAMFALGLGLTGTLARRRTRSRGA